MDVFVSLAYFIRDWWFLITALIGILASGYKGVMKINDTLKSINYQLEKISTKIEFLERGREQIDKRLQDHEILINKLRRQNERTEDRVNENQKDIAYIQKKVDR